MIDRLTSITGVDAVSTFDSKNKILQEEDKLNNFSNILNEAMTEENSKEIKNACVEFETYFLQMIMKEMRKTVNTDNSFIKESNAEKIYKEYLDNEVMKQASEMGGVGLADAMYESLSRNNSIDKI